MLRILISIVGLSVVVGILGGIKALQIATMVEAGENFVPPPTTVSTAQVTEDHWAPSLRAVGTIVATQGVLVSTEVPGTVKKLWFDSGDPVKANSLLVELDASIERAELASARATAELAELSLRRARGLARKKINTPADLDLAKAESKQAKAQVARIIARIAQKTIRAPFAGTLGIRQVDLGQILSAGNPVVSLQALDQVYVDFYLPQQEVGRIKVGQSLSLSTDAHPAREWKGTVEAIEPTIEVATRNLRIRGIVDNASHALRPGMFAAVQVVLPVGPPVLVVPATAVVFATHGNSVYVVEDAPSGTHESKDPTANDASPPTPGGKVARQVMVETGQRRGDFVAITSGLEQGQTVVTAGAFKLRSGVPVVVKNGTPLKPALAPKPKDS